MICLCCHSLGPLPRLLCPESGRHSQSAKRSTDFLRWMIFDLEREHFIGQSLFRGGAELKSMDHHIVDLKRTDHHETFQIDLSPIWLNHNQFIRVEKGDEIGR